MPTLALVVNDYHPSLFNGNTVIVLRFLICQNMNMF